MGEFEVGVRSLVLHNRKVLLLRRSNKPGIRSVSWEFPGGKINFGEDLHTALYREIEEEAGLENIRIEKLLFAVTFLTGLGKQAVGLMYLSHASSDTVRISDEHDDFIWASRSKLVGLLHKGMLNELKEHSVLESLEL